MRAFVLMSVLLASSCAGAPEQSVEQPVLKPAACAAQGALVDLEAMRDAVKRSMAYPLGGGVLVDSVFDALRPQAEAAQTESDHLRVLEAFVYDLGDHHAHISTNDAKSPRLVPTGATVWVEWRKGELVVTEVRDHLHASMTSVADGETTKLFVLREGMVIEKIKGTPAAEALKPPPHLPQLTDAMMGFAGRVALAGTREKPVMVSVRAGDGRLVDMPLLPAGDGGAGDLATLKFPQRDVAVIRLNNSIGNPDMSPVFDQLMKQAKGVKSIILDLRDTPSGGDSSVAKPLMAWFVDATRGYQKHERDGKSWVEQVTGRPDRFTGKLVVLVDHWTGSMGEGAAIGLRAAAGAKLVGTPMAGLRGAIESFDVPCRGVSLRIPVERLYEVGGGPRELAMPDVLVTEEELAAGGDVMLAKALLLAQ